METPNRQEARDRELFDSIAQAYVQKDLKPSSRAARKHRLQRSLEIAGLPKSCVLLEVGCGGGFSANYLRGYYSEYHGVDYSSELISYAESHHSYDDVHFYPKNIKEFMPPVGITAILMIGVLHHIDDMQQALKSMYQMLEPGGVLVANEPHPGNPIISAARSIRKRLDSNYSSDQAELSGAELRALYRNAGFQDIGIHPQGYFSTPFAEVPFGPQALTQPLSRLACLVDRKVEEMNGRLLTSLSWNLVAVGRRPVE